MIFQLQHLFGFIRCGTKEDMYPVFVLSSSTIRRTRVRNMPVACRFPCLAQKMLRKVDKFALKPVWAIDPDPK